MTATELGALRTADSRSRHAAMKPVHDWISIRQPLIVSEPHADAPAGKGAGGRRGHHHRRNPLRSDRLAGNANVISSAQAGIWELANHR